MGYHLGVKIVVINFIQFIKNALKESVDYFYDSNGIAIMDLIIRIWESNFIIFPRNVNSTVNFARRDLFGFAVRQFISKNHQFVNFFYGFYIFHIFRS